MVTKERLREIKQKYADAHKAEKSARMKLYRAKNRDKVHAWAAKYRERHREVSRRWKLARPGWWKKYQQTPHGRFNTYKGAAKYRGIVFSISEEHFTKFWQSPCFYCGQPIETIGLDRIDSAKGYTEENIRPCDIVCNKAKSVLTHQEFIAMCHRIAQRHPI